MRTFKEGDLVISVSSGKLGIVASDEQPGDMGVTVRWPHNSLKHDEVVNTPPSNLKLILEASRDSYDVLHRLTTLMGNHLQKAQASDEALAALKDKLSGNLEVAKVSNKRLSPRVTSVLKNVLNVDTMKPLLSDNPLDIQRNAEKWEFLEAALMVLDQKTLLNRPNLMDPLPTENFSVIDVWYQDTPEDEPVRLVLLGDYWYDADNEYRDVSKIESFRIAKVSGSNG